MMLFGAIALFATFLIVSLFALRGRRIDDHPVCRHCGFDLVGIPQPQTCPECGISLATRVGVIFDRAPTRAGNRKRRPWLAAATGVLALAFGVGVLLLGWDAWSRGGWNSNKPVWWLVLDARADGTQKADDALSELSRRQNAGQLTSDQLASLIEQALERQADANSLWTVKWGDIIEDAWKARALTKAQQTQYAANAASLRVTARPQVRQGDYVPAYVTIVPRAGSRELLAFELRLLGMDIGGQQLKSGVFGDGPLTVPSDTSELVMDFAPDQGFIVPQSQRIPAFFTEGDQPVAKPPGHYQLRTTWRLSVGPSMTTSLVMGGGMSWSPRATTLQSYSPLDEALSELDVVIDTPVEIVGSEAETVELVVGADLEWPLRNAIRVEVVDELGFPYGPAARCLHLSGSYLPVDIAFDVTVRGGGEERHSRVAVHSSTGTWMSVTEVPPGGPESTYEVTLTPSQDLARRTVRIFKIAGSELHYDGLTIREAWSSPLPGKFKQPRK